VLSFFSICPFSFSVSVAFLPSSRLLLQGGEVDLRQVDQGLGCRSRPDAVAVGGNRVVEQGIQVVHHPPVADAGP